MNKILLKCWLVWNDLYIYRSYGYICWYYCSRKHGFDITNTIYTIVDVTDTLSNVTNTTIDVTDVVRVALPAPIAELPPSRRHHQHVHVQGQNCWYTCVPSITHSSRIIVNMAALTTTMVGTFAFRRLIRETVVLPH